MAEGPQDPPRHVGRVVRRVLLRRNIAIDTETAQLVADAVQAALRAGAPSRPPRRDNRVPPARCGPCSDPTVADLSQSVLRAVPRGTTLSSSRPANRWSAGFSGSLEAQRAAPSE